MGKKVIATTDIVVIHKRYILLIKRKYEPYKDCWALPGGHIDVTDKDIVSCAQRELKEETNLDIPLNHFYYIQTVGNNTRDPRGFALTNVFRVKLETIPDNLKACDDAKELKWIDVTKLPTLDYELAFDHKKLIKSAWPKNDYLFF